MSGCGHLMITTNMVLGVPRIAGRSHHASGDRGVQFLSGTWVVVRPLVDAPRKIVEDDQIAESRRPLFGACATARLGSVASQRPAEGAPQSGDNLLLLR
jgi:hypothetical protein